MKTTQHQGRSQWFLSALLSSALLIGPVAAEESVESYLDLDLADLLSMEVTSVSKKKQRLTEAAAAIFVITQDDIRRSGVTSIPEALRMAPGLQVAKLDSNRWAISSRGFNSQFANKLLVLIDGRTVYTPSYSGVYWDVQDTLLQDIDRIEVIRGPGTTVWGANAVNGVINIITKQASETQGGLLVAGGGNEEKCFASLRYGMELGYRVQPAETLSLDLALFYNKYENLQTFEIADSVGFPNPSDPLGPPILLPAKLAFENEARGTSQGLELAVDWRLREWWRLQANYSYLRISVDTDSDSDDNLTAAVLEGSSPKHQLSVRSAMDISNDWSLDLWAYYVDELAITSYSNTQAISDYLSLNTRLAWRPQGEFGALTGRPQFTGQQASGICRGVYCHPDRD